MDSLIYSCKFYKITKRSLFSIFHLLIGSLSFLNLLKVSKFQVRLTDGLVSALNFQKGKEMELAWLDSRVSGRKKTSLIKPINLEEPDNGHREPEEELMDIDGGESECHSQPTVNIIYTIG